MGDELAHPEGWSRVRWVDVDWLLVASPPAAAGVSQSRLIAPESGDDRVRCLRGA